jgi:hypothetical protein
MNESVSAGCVKDRKIGVGATDPAADGNVD